jgi:hypothetical protein
MKIGEFWAMGPRRNVVNAGRIRIAIDVLPGGECALALQTKLQGIDKITQDFVHGADFTIQQP